MNTKQNKRDIIFSDPTEVTQHDQPDLFSLKRLISIENFKNELRINNQVDLQLKQMQRWAI